MSPAGDRHSVESLNALRRHAEQVEASYKVALTHISLFPEEHREKMRAAVESEFRDFQSAVQLFASRVPIDTIQQTMTSGKVVAPWIMRHRTPKSIARYSHSQVDSKDLRQRKALSEARLATFQERFAAACATVAEIPLSDEQRKAAMNALKHEHDAMLQAFNLYKKGFSFGDIDRITKVGMQDRALDGRLPPLTRHYGGDILTPEEIAARQMKASRMVAKANSALQNAEKKYATASPEAREARMHALREDVERVSLVVRLYERGISPLRIRRLTRLPAPEWLACETLPVKLLRAAEPLYKRDFTIPKQHTEASAYIAGAFFGRLRLSNPQIILFAAPTHEAAEKLRHRFAEAFGHSPNLPRTHGDMHLVHISRKALIEPFCELMGATDGDKVTVPRILIDYSFYRKPFLEGFFEFAAGTVHTSIPRFTISRVLRGDVLAHVAVALSYEGIYPNITCNESGAAKLQIDDAREIRRLLTMFPSITDAQTRDKALTLATRNESCLDTVVGYETVMRILARDYPKGTKLNFEDVRDKGGAVLQSLTLCPWEKQRIKGWRAGLVPKVCVRAKRLAKLAALLVEPQGR